MLLSQGYFSAFILFGNSATTLVILQTKKILCSHKVFFLSLYVGFVVILDVTQGCYCNYHILNIILKKTCLHTPTCGRLPRRSNDACGAFRQPKVAFWGNVRNISMPCTSWNDAFSNVDGGLSTTIIFFLFFLSFQSFVSAPIKFQKQPL